MSRPNLSAGLRRCRALSVCLGERSYYVKPCDLPRGRPPREAAAFLQKWKKPYRPTGLYEDMDFDELLECDPLAAILPDCVDYLNRTGSCRGWFEIDERARILGSPVSLLVRSYDVLVTAGSIFEGPNTCFFASTGYGEPCRRGFVPMTGPAPTQRTRARRIQDASNIGRAVHAG